MERLLLNVEEGREIINLGRSRFYDMIATGEIPSIRIGKSIRISVKALNAWVEKQPNGYGIPNELDES